MQALLDNYEVWAMDMLSDKQKAAIARDKEEARVRAAKMAADEGRSDGELE